MSHIDPDTRESPESVAMQIIRCADCGAIHIGMFDDDENLICEMTLDDSEVIRMAVQLLQSVYPALHTGKLQAAISAISKFTDRPH